MLYKYVGQSLAQSANNNYISKREDGYYQVKIASFELIPEDDLITKQGYELQSILNTFNSESVFMKRVNTECVAMYGEYGFPDTSSYVVDADQNVVDGMYSQRFAMINMRNLAIRYDDIKLEIKTDNDLISTINLIAMVKPCGLNKVFIEDLFTDPQNTNWGFGMRAFTNDALEKINGDSEIPQYRTAKTLIECITFDFIQNPKVQN